MGILATLDDVCLFPGGNDASLVDRLVSQHQNHAKFIVPEMKSRYLSTLPYIRCFVEVILLSFTMLVVWTIALLNGASKIWTH